ncbi:MAG: hypothetical protein MJ123_05865 [Lachnospiraceae bacterium]|nr:hypothetical protein [Lachnospiraceae bacterium]
MLKNQDNFSYLEIYDNPCVIISPLIKDEMLDLYESGDTEMNQMIYNGRVTNEVKCLWVDLEAVDYYRLKCQKGSFWDDGNNKSFLPIVLGSDYKDIFSIGDIVDGYSPFDGEIKYIVNGFLEKGAFCMYHGSVKNLDRYVVAPLIKLSNEKSDEENDAFQDRIYHLFKVNGVIISKDSLQRVDEVIKEICDECGITPASTVILESDTQNKVIEQKKEYMGNLLNLLIVSSLIFSIVSVLIFPHIYIGRNRQYFNILWDNGFSLLEVNAIVCITLSIPLILCVMICGKMLWLLIILLIVTCVELRVIN